MFSQGRLVETLTLYPVPRTSHFTKLYKQLPQPKRERWFKKEGHVIESVSVDKMRQKTGTWKF
jgi:hypothetical protein